MRIIILPIIIISFWPHHTACEILVPQPGINLLPTVESQNPNHWTAREVPYVFILSMKEKI